MTDASLRRYWRESKRRERHRDEPQIGQWRTWANPSLGTREQRLGWLEIDLPMAVAQAAGLNLSLEEWQGDGPRVRWIGERCDEVLGSDYPLGEADRVLDRIEAGEVAAPA